MDNDKQEFLIENAKKLAKGPLGQEITKFPLKFAKAIFFGKRPIRKDIKVEDNATITLIKSRSNLIGITCHHVISKYKKKLKEDKDFICQIGNTEISVLERVIAENKLLDLITVDLNNIKFKDADSDPEIGGYFFDIEYLVSKEIYKKDKIVLGGFPQILRERISKIEVLFNSFSVMGFIEEVKKNEYVCKFEKRYWVDAINNIGIKDVKQLGGLSGCPVFKINDKNRKISFFEFIGIVYSYMRILDEVFIVKIRPAKFIKQDGQLENLSEKNTN